jgi:ABC-type antimicrobial peptide transport system permease subunit
MDAGSARFLWGRHNPIGRSIKFGDAQSKAPWYRVVGVTKDQRDTATIRRRDYSYGYRLTQVYRVVAPDDSLQLQRRMWGSLTLYARVQGNTELAAVRLQRNLRTLASVDRPTVTPIVDDWIMYQQARQDFVAVLFGTFAFLGLSLVAVGVYGIVSHSIAERRRELAVRISLGATARNILHSVLREGNALILAGIAFGLLFTKYTVWWLSMFMDDNAGYDALLFAVIATGLFALAAFAAFIPALRATRIDPVDALRHE